MAVMKMVKDVIKGIEEAVKADLHSKSDATAK